MANGLRVQGSLVPLLPPSGLVPQPPTQQAVSPLSRPPHPDGCHGVIPITSGHPGNPRCQAVAVTF